jgi:putative glutamine amidotransferase
MTQSRRPIVGIPCDRKLIGGMPFHAVGEKYIEAVRDVAEAMPVLIPVTSEPFDQDPILDYVDGLFFTGSASNVAPVHYGGHAPRNEKLLDPYRDATTLPLLTAAIKQQKPVFAVCRGMQELNVALGGTLDQHVEELPGRLDHRDDESAPEDVRYGAAHEVEATPGGLIEKITGEHRFKVNSLHGQAIGRLAPGLAVEAKAPDGTIEAVSRPGGKGFLLAVQWHPEWRAKLNPVSVKLLRAFGAALRGENNAGK